MGVSFEHNAYNKVLEKTGLAKSGIRGQVIKVLIPFVLCWLPLAILTLVYQTFWTGNAATSFITNFNAQARLLIAMPVFILAEKVVSERVAIILAQFFNSGIIQKEEQNRFDEIIQKNSRFLRSNWTDLVVIVICFLQVFSMQLYQISSRASLISWQIMFNGEEAVMNPAGWWYVLVSKPFFLFLFYRWMLRILIFGKVLYKISWLRLNLFAAHSDQAGGLGFLGYTMRYFSLIAFAISVTVAGNMADLILIEGYHLADFKLKALAYFIFITILFSYPLYSFINILIKTRERSIFENYDVANGMYNEFGKKWARGFYDIKREDLERPDFSTITDMSSIMKSVLEMKSLPFAFKDLLPLWFMTLLPFLPVIAMEIPLLEVLTTLMQIFV